MTGGALAFALTEAVGLAAAIFPMAWLGLFTDDAGMLETGSAYLRLVGPTYGFFGLGLCLYFASQGAGRLFWPLAGGTPPLVALVGTNIGAGQRDRALRIALTGGALGAAGGAVTSPRNVNLGRPAWR